MSIPPSQPNPLPGVDTGETFPHELKEIDVRMDMAILFAIIKKRERTVHPQENECMTGDIFMHCCAQAIRSGGTHKLFSDKDNCSKFIHLEYINIGKAFLDSTKIYIGYYLFFLQTFVIEI